MNTAEPRPVPRITAELAEVRRHLVDAPPHHGAGVRAALQDRVASLERELAAARNAARTTDRAAGAAAGEGPSDR
jgi:hypothetical protein